LGISDTNVRVRQGGQNLSPAEAGHKSEHSGSESHRNLLSEEIFLRMLCMERKRAERSGRTFLLVLLDGEQLFEQSPAAVSRVSACLCKAIRETDLIGWQQEGAAIGIILTEIGGAEKSAIQQAMLDTLTATLRGALETGQTEMIRIAFYFFPDEQEQHKSGRSADGKLYPDLQWAGKSKRLERWLKRAIDITGSLMALLVLSPVFAVIAVAIKLTSKGPVLFRQTRVGQYGAPFYFLKFRSMRTDSDPQMHREFVNEFIRGSSNPAQSGQTQKKVYKITDDPRVTRVGKFLRKNSLDELPQFWNVLKGEMSLVGPRPPIPYELESYRPWHKRRILEVKPGLTGLWQIYGRSRTTFDEMVRLDLRYARTWSLLLDLKILLQTPRAMFSGEGAY
jgi:lipopolysaccharide/colanic/teichoic acid biosynthesis glycosyltransferase